MGTGTGYINEPSGRMSVDRVIDKIRKLTALSESSNEHEAAAAAAHAARLMQEYQIEEAQIIANDPSFRDDPIENGTIIGVMESQEMVTWRLLCAQAATLATGCCLWTRKYKGMPRIEFRVIGRLADAQAAGYLYNAIANQIDKICDAQWSRTKANAPRFAKGSFMAALYGEPPSPRAWKHSFRLGAASTVFERVKEEMEKPKAAATGTALAVIDKRQQEIDRIKGESGMKENKRAPKAGDAAGFLAGRRAGLDVQLNGGPNRLAAPAKEIKGG